MIYPFVLDKSPQKKSSIVHLGFCTFGSVVFVVKQGVLIYPFVHGKGQQKMSNIVEVRRALELKR